MIVLAHSQAMQTCRNSRDTFTLLLTICADGVLRVPPFVIVKGAEGDPGTLRQPRLWGQERAVNIVKGTAMEFAAVAQQPNAYMTNAIFIVWVRDGLIPALGASSYWFVAIS